MKEKKNIDRLFQERFKDFEVQPRPEIWKGIEARLDDKKKKRRSVIPLWLKVGGIAALLALLALIADFYNHSDKDGQQFVNGNNTQKVEKDPIVKGQPILTETYTKDSTDLGSTVGSQIADGGGQAEKDTKGSKNDIKSTGNSRVNGLATTQYSKDNKESNNSSKDPSKRARKNSGFDQTSIIAQTGKDSITTNKKDRALIEYSSQKKSRNNSGNNILAQNQKETKSKILSSAEKDSLAEKKDRIRKNAIANTTANSKNDSTAQQKSLLELVNENKEKDAIAEDSEDSKKEESIAKRWGLTPMIAPVYYNSFSGSGIGPQFDGSNKDGDLNLSYGLQVSYAVNTKIKIRSGINRVKLGYNTNEVKYSPGGMPQEAIQSINYKKNADVINVVQNQTLPNASLVPNNNASLLEVTPAPVLSGSLEQRLAYYEVPLEMSYEVLDKKIGLQFIGGLSTLFLNQDEIILQDSGFTTLLGNSNSLNNVSFSTNVGIGLDYNFSESIQFNLEPMFKYQLNAYKNSVQDFTPYYLGLYTGLSIKF